MPKLNLSSSEIAAIRRDYQAGQSSTEIASRVGITAPAVLYHCQDIKRSQSEARRVRKYREILESTFCTAYDVALTINLTRAHVNNLCQEGKFPGAFRFGKSPHAPWIIPLRAVDDYRPKKEG